MAEMETVIINPEFVKSLEKNRSILNSAFEYYNSGMNRIESSDIFNVFTRIMNPLYDNGPAVPDKISVSIFITLLNLISKKLIGSNCRDREQEILLFAMTDRFKNLLAEHGGSFLINILNALINLTSKKNISVRRWASLLLSLPADTDLDGFRKYGFIAAWICGAAAAGERSASLIRTADPSVLKILFNIADNENINPENIADTMFKNPWENPISASREKNDLSPVFKTAGGFRGYGFEFRSLPLVVSIDECFYAADGSDVFRLYGDYFGIELVREKNINQESIHPGGVINRFVKGRTFTFDNKSHPLPAQWKTGVTSIAFNKNTVVWTLNDSYKLYIAGIRNNA
jgi:hypothetical protein